MSTCDVYDKRRYDELYRIDLSNSESLIKYDRVAGKQGESNVKGVRFTIPSEYSEGRYIVQVGY